MADYTGFILGVDNIVGLQTLSQSLAIFPIGNVLLAEPYSPNGLFPVINTLPQAIYRGKIGGNYVFKTGSPPVGATDVVIVGYYEG
ncbi:MAG: hypothetical protein EBU90_19865 [Proteobacteria bacterium]|nr:hypothetical protein [Pseudomonadota bacterium]NBP16292.1 hypothetical protein [bacterium]